MIKRLKLAFMATVALSIIATPAFSQTARTTPHRHFYNSAPNRLANGAYDYSPNPGVAPPSDPVNKPSDPVNNPMMSGGGSMGYNKYMGHAH